MVVASDDGNQGFVILFFFFLAMDLVGIDMGSQESYAIGTETL